MRVGAFLTDCAALVTVLGFVLLVLGPSIRRTRRERRHLRRGLEDLLEIHNFPRPPPPGHLWPQRWRDFEEDSRVS